MAIPKTFNDPINQSDEETKPDQRLKTYEIEMKFQTVEFKHCYLINN